MWSIGVEASVAWLGIQPLPLSARQCAMDALPDDLGVIPAVVGVEGILSPSVSRLVQQSLSASAAYFSFV